MVIILASLFFCLIAVRRGRVRRLSPKMNNAELSVMPERYEMIPNRMETNMSKTKSLGISSQTLNFISNED